MLYVPICDETNKLESIKLKRKVEIKGENVSMISPVWAQRPIGPLDRVLIGGAQPNYGWWAPVTCAYIKRWGSGHAVRGSPRCQAPHRHSRPDLGQSVESDGKLRVHHSSLSPPSHLRQPWPPEVASRVKEKVYPYLLSPVPNPQPIRSTEVYQQHL